MSRAIPALFAQHALVDNDYVSAHVPSRIQSSKMYSRLTLYFVGLSHWDTIPNSGPGHKFHVATFQGCVRAVVFCTLWDQTLKLQRYYLQKLWFLQLEGRILDIDKGSALNHTYRKESVRASAKLLLCSESSSWLSLKSTAKLQGKCRPNKHAWVC